MTAIEKVISIARAELGYHEKSSNSALDDKTANAGGGNWTKYARDLDAVSGFYNGPKNGYAWCDVFVDWCFVTAFGAETAKKLLCQPDRSAGAGCTYSAGYYRARGQFHETGPEPGDQIFFGTARESTHTGLVVAVDGARVHTVEGNSSNGVFERSYELGSSGIYGYGRPEWSIVNDELGMRDEKNDELGMMNDELKENGAGSGCAVELPELYAGCAGEAVKAAQMLLIGRGCSCGPDGADGDFGANTKNAVLRFQRAKGLEDDGVIGVNTWTSLLTRK